MSPADWIAASEALPFFDFVPVSNSIALKSVQLPGILHNDPADRIIIATAVFSGSGSSDERRKNKKLPACQNCLVE